MGALLSRVPSVFIKPARGRWVPVLVAISVLVAAGGVALDRWQNQMQQDFESLFSARETYRDSWIVCEERMTTRCAAEAADQAKRPIAWVAEPAKYGLRLDAVAAAHGKAQGFAAQEIKGDSFIVSIVTNNEGSPFGRRIDTVRARGREAEVWKDDDSIEVRWSEMGVPYNVHVSSMTPRPEFGWSERSLAEALFNEIRFTAPAGEPAAS